MKEKLKQISRQAQPDPLPLVGRAREGGHRQSPRWTFEVLQSAKRFWKQTTPPYTPARCLRTRFVVAPSVTPAKAGVPFSLLSHKSCARCLSACLLAALVLPPSPAAAQSSLFFTLEETQSIETLAQAETKKSEQGASPASGDISLDAILYYGPRNWKIWLQGEPWTPETSRPGLRVLKVSPNRVVLEINLNPPTKIALRPYQTWSIANRQFKEIESNDEEE
ncbi:MAG: hypothetical protein ABTQ34_01155 [Bdellovibrionales bacterium]